MAISMMVLRIFAVRTKRAYAGILSGTVLGAPLADAAGITTKWAGRFRDTYYATRESGASFELTVQFAAQGGTLDGIVTGSSTLGVGIDGAFDAKGIITGDVIYGNIATGNCVTSGALTVTEGCFTDNTSRRKATLTGLIGEQGAVGAFIGQRGSFPSIFGWVGGFVATPDFCGNTSGTANDPECNTNRDDWVGSFGNDAPPVTVTAAAQTGVFGGFLDIASGTTIDAGGLTLMTATARGAGNPTPSTSASLNRPGSGDSGASNIDGIIYINGFNGNNNQAFVGIRPGTNLGAPLTSQPVIAAWPGLYYDSTVSATAQNAVTFNIDFSNRSIGTSIADSVINPPTFDLGFTRAGVITGTVTKNSLEATARGLIGQQGLIGAFVDTGATSGTVFHGGFVATNPSP